MFTWIIGHLLAACIGLSLGLMGGGGSVLALPILVYVMGVEPKPAIAMTLAIVGTVSLLGVVSHWRSGNVNLKTAVIFGSATTVGAYGGARIATLPFVSATFQLLLFAVMMLLAAGFMIRRSARSVSASEASQPVHKNLANYPKPACQYCWLWLMTEGIGVGILTGLVGVGGGFAIVPALVLLGNVPMKQAIGTSLLIIVFNSIAGMLGYIGHVEFDLPLILSFIVAASLGTLPGAYLAQFVPAQRLQQFFGYFLVTVAAFILVQNRDVFQFSSRRSPPAHSAITQSSHPASSLGLRRIRSD